MSEFIGTEASYWDSRVDQKYELMRLGETHDATALAIWRVTQNLLMIDRYVVESDPNFHRNKEIYDEIVERLTEELYGLPE